jgi:riboflavin kinase/FMN adenylyltransferase
MEFQTRQIKGDGRGKKIGYPTINLVIPDDFSLGEGIYRSSVTISKDQYVGALYYGPIVTYGGTEHKLEIYLLDVTDENFPDTGDGMITVRVKEYIRAIKKFDTTEELAQAIADDVEKVRSLKKLA